jgi:copper(I)-binding protein
VTRSTVTHSIVRTRAGTALLAGAALATVMLVSGCGTGQISATALTVPAVPGVNSVPSPGDLSGIALRNVLLRYPGTQGYQRGQDAPLELRILNSGNQDVTLVQVTSPSAASVKLTGSASPTPTSSASSTPTETPSSTAKASSSASPTGSSANPTGTKSSASASPTSPASATPSQAASQPIDVPIPAGEHVTLSPGSGTTLLLVGLTQDLLTGQSIPITFGFSGGVQFTLDVPVDVPMSPAPRSPLVFETSTDNAQG